MIRFRDPTENLRQSEGRPSVAVVLPHAHDRPLMRTALALAHARRGPLRAFALHEPGEELPAPLRLQLYGLWTLSEADRAIRHLVDSAIRGAHVAVQHLDLDGGEARVHGLGDSVPLLTGWVRGRSQLDREQLRALLIGHPGDAALVADHSGPAFSEVLALGSGAALQALSRPLAACYPVFEVAAPDAATARRALSDASPHTLVLLGLPADGGLGPFAEWAGRLEEAAPGTVLAALPRGAVRGAALEAMLGDAP